MGTEEFENTKTPLVEFLYKDTSLIDSFYAQIFQGNLSSIIKSSGSGENSRKRIGFDVKLASGDLESGEELSESISSSIDPHDFKVFKLLHELVLNETSQEMVDGQIINVRGSLNVFCKEYIIKVMVPLKIMGVMEELYRADSGLLQKKGNSSTKVPMEIAIKQLIELLPYGTTGILSSEGEEYTCLLKDEYMLTSAEKLVSSFGSRLSGQYIIVGICNLIHPIFADDLSKTIANTEDSFAKALHLFEDAPISVLKYSTSSVLITPIVIYREILY